MASRRIFSLIRDLPIFPCYGLANFPAYIVEIFLFNILMLISPHDSRMYALCCDSSHLMLNIFETEGHSKALKMPYPSGVRVEQIQSVWSLSVNFDEYFKALGSHVREQYL